MIKCHTLSKWALSLAVLAISPSAVSAADLSSVKETTCHLLRHHHRHHRHRHRRHEQKGVIALADFAGAWIFHAHTVGGVTGNTTGYSKAYLGQVDIDTQGNIVVNLYEQLIYEGNPPLIVRTFTTQDEIRGKLVLLDPEIGYARIQFTSPEEVGIMQSLDIIARERGNEVIRMQGILSESNIPSSGTFYFGFERQFD